MATRLPPPSRTPVTRSKRTDSKRALRGDALLLTDDERKEFDLLLNELFKSHHPASQEEARCLETVAANELRIARCQRAQKVIDTQIERLLMGGDGPQPRARPAELGAWMKKASANTREEIRLLESAYEAMDRLFHLKRMRRSQHPGAADEGPIYWPVDLPRPARAQTPKTGGSHDDFQALPDDGVIYN